MNIFNARTAIARTGIAAAFALGTCLIANTAAAKDPTLNQVTVSYADLDLSKPAGAQALYKRIRAAASKVCTPRVTISPIYRGRSFVKCYDEVMASAVAQVNRPVLTALYKEKTAKTARG
jgi:UrcA family protein